MNERIKELMKQAGNDSANFYSHQYLELVPPEVLAKFAELIVKEVADRVYPYDEVKYQAVLKEFGVEE